MLQKLILSVVVAVVAYLVCILVGGLLVDLKVDFAQTIGGFLRSWAAVIALLTGLWYFFAGGFTITRNP
jgi:hypothetical protein